MDERNNYALNDAIERFIDAYDGTSIGQSVKNMYENGTSYESICDYLGWDMDDYSEWLKNLSNNLRVNGYKASTMYGDCIDKWYTAYSLNGSTI